METIYLSLRAQVAVGTFFMKSPVSDSWTGSGSAFQDAHLGSGSAIWIRWPRIRFSRLWPESGFKMDTGSTRGLTLALKTWCWFSSMMRLFLSSSAILRLDLTLTSGRTSRTRRRTNNLECSNLINLFYWSEAVISDAQIYFKKCIENCLKIYKLFLVKTTLSTEIHLLITKLRTRV